MDKVKKLTPFPVGRVKNKWLRRLLMILFFLPICVVGWTLHAIMALSFFVKGVCYVPFTLVMSGIEYWDKPGVKEDG